MTFRQSNNIMIGYDKRKRVEHEDRILESRILVSYLMAAINPKDNRSFNQIYEIASDKRREKVSKNYLPPEVFEKIFVSTLNLMVNNNER
jgi:hypothetical protein